MHKLSSGHLNDIEMAVSAALYEARQLLKHLTVIPDHIAVQLASMAADVNDSNRRRFLKPRL